jgi:hypothetical protein
MPTRKQPSDDNPRSLLAAAAARMASPDPVDEPVDVRRPSPAPEPAAAPEPVAASEPSTPAVTAAPALQYPLRLTGSAPPPLPGDGGVPPAPEKKKSGVKTTLVAGGVALGGIVALLMVLGFVAASQKDDSDIDLPRVETPVIPAEVLYTPVAGYALEDPPADLLQAVREPFDEDPVVARALRDMSARAITQDGELAALVFVFQFTNDFSAGGDASFESFARGFKEEAEDSHEVRVGGNRGLYFTLENGVSGFAAMKGANVVMVEGNVDGAELQRLTEQFLARVP